MAINTTVISTYEAGRGSYAKPKTPETFADDINKEYERIRRLGGQVIASHVIGMPVRLEAPEDHQLARETPPQMMFTEDRQPKDHLVIVADLPK